MATKKIIAVGGVHFADDDVEHVDMKSNTSLLDWDIILFRPLIDEFCVNERDRYMGKISLNDDRSFQLRQCSEHWRREIRQAVEGGKTVIVFLSAFTEVYAATGQKTHSGTGKGRLTTTIVDLVSTYHSIPAELAAVPTLGSSMKLRPLEAEVLAPYWKEFESASQYQALLTHPQVPVAITTRSGDKAVGALYPSKSSSGTLVLLPDIDFVADEFFDGENWNEVGEQFAARFLSTVVALDRALHAGSDITPEPEWATAAEFISVAERALLEAVLSAESAVEIAQRAKEQALEALAGAGAYRYLLYEKGKPLEFAILQGLQLMGFSATSYKDATSEFDVVFECAEGRLIGEAEGKDSKAVNVDKLRQLAMNVIEDFQRDSVDRQAKPVLFGNGFRLSAPQDRADTFTEKCKTAAMSSSTALVATADLYVAVKNLLDEPDEGYAGACRQAILTGIGRVVFPVKAPLRLKAVGVKRRTVRAKAV